ncbi:MAG: hypothetical protein JXB39_08570 [Deltaproteobacteria bacterium]|nr:hypothetical protein [Deltaproteobacteria bacterium]
MSRAEAVRARLTQDALDRFAALAVDDGLSRSLAELAASPIVAEVLARALRQAAGRPETAEGLRAEVRRLAARAAAPVHPRARLRQRIPKEITDPLRHLLADPWVPEEDLVLRLIDHEAMRFLVQEVLQESAVGLVRRLRALAPERLPALGRAVRRTSVGHGLSRLKAIGSGMVSAVGSEIEEHLEQRAREFVGQGIRAALLRVARLLTDPARAGTLADWRAHLLDAVLDTSDAAWAREARKTDPDRLAGALLEGIERLAARPDLQAVLEDLLARATGAWSQGTLGDRLEAAGLLDPFREAATALVRERAARLVETPAFQVFLDDLLEDRST